MHLTTKIVTIDFSDEHRIVPEFLFEEEEDKFLCDIEIVHEYSPETPNEKKFWRDYNLHFPFFEKGLNLIDEITFINSTGDEYNYFYISCDNYKECLLLCDRVTSTLTYHFMLFIPNESVPPILLQQNHFLFEERNVYFSAAYERYTLFNIWFDQGIDFVPSIPWQTLLSIDGRDGVVTTMEEGFALSRKIVDNLLSLSSGTEILDDNLSSPLESDGPEIIEVPPPLERVEFIWEL